MAESTGIVNAVEVREGKFGDQVRVNVSGTWYDYGKYPPRGIKEGDTVKVTFTTNDRGYHKIERNGLIAVSPGSAGVTPSTQTVATKPTYVDNRQDTISKQAAVNTAIQMVDLLIKHGGIKLPAKAPDAYAVIAEAVQAEAIRLYAQNTGGVWVMAEDSVMKDEVRSPSSAGDNGADDYPD